MIFRKAQPEKYETVRAFYYRLIDDMEGLPYHPRWQKGIYPEDDYLHASIEKGELFLCEEGEILGAMILSHHTTDGYETVRWGVEAAPEEVTVIHTLGVKVSHMGQGVGKAMVHFALEHARKANQKAIRLDVLEGNVPAMKLYKSCGFRYITRLELFYEDTGLCEFDLMEYVL